MRQPPRSPRPPALTMVEPAGIGPDLTLMIWARRQALDPPPFYCLADPALLADRARRLGMECQIVEGAAEGAAAAFARALPVVRLAADGQARPGRPDGKTSLAVIESIRRAVDDVK